MKWLASALFCVMIVRAADPPAGNAIYQAHCAKCHDATAAGRIPSKATLQKMTPHLIMTALTDGVMKTQGAALSEQERWTVAHFLGTANTAPIATNRLENPCAGQPSSKSAGDWISWGAGLLNWRFQADQQAGLTAADVPKLKLKWAFGLPNVTMMRSQPVVWGGRVYAGGDNGVVYALDAQKGCEYWATSGKQVRSGIVMGEAAGAKALFFGDVTGSVTALDAKSGNLLWQVRVGDHADALVTGTPAFADGRLYVPVSSYEEVAAVFPGYQCCTFRGSVVALEAGSGKEIWRVRTVTEEPKEQRKLPDGRAVFGPSGAAVWSTPTVDEVKGRIYFTSGDNYSDPATKTSDALFAVDSKTGALLWSKQFTRGDTFNVSCGEGGKGNCPSVPGKDLDFGSPPILVELHSGKRELLLAQKSGMVYKVDPDADGAILWQSKAAEGGALGGIQWGPATDGRNICVTLCAIRQI